MSGVSQSGGYLSALAWTGPANMWRLYMNGRPDEHCDTQTELRALQSLNWDIQSLPAARKNDSQLTVQIGTDTVPLRLFISVLPETPVRPGGASTLQGYQLLEAAVKTFAVQGVWEEH